MTARKALVSTEKASAGKKWFGKMTPLFHTDEHPILPLYFSCCCVRDAQREAPQATAI